MSQLIGKGQIITSVIFIGKFRYNIHHVSLVFQPIINKLKIAYSIFYGIDTLL